MSDDEPPIVPPPSSMTAEFERKPVLWLPDGRALVRRIGYDTGSRPKEKA